MARVIIECCGEKVIDLSGTKEFQSGSGRCPQCGCSYGWKDLGDWRVKTWTEKACNLHGPDAGKLVLCEYCGGVGEREKKICRGCNGSGLQRI